MVSKVVWYCGGPDIDLFPNPCVRIKMANINFRLTMACSAYKADLSDEHQC